MLFFFFSSRRRHTRYWRDWSSDVCSSDLEAMDLLRGGIGLRAIGQKDPLVEYKREGFRMFKQLIALLDADVATTIFKVSVRQEEVPLAAPVQTALTRAAEQAQTNASGELGGNGATAKNDTKSRSERRAR